MTNQKNPQTSDIQEASEGLKIVNLPKVTEWCTTGSTLLDLAISNTLSGGVPVGRITQIYGGFSAGKSVIASAILGSALRTDFLAFYADVEFTFDPDFAKLYGLDAAHPNFYWGYSWKDEFTQPENLEELFDSWIGGIIEKFGDKKKILVVDSLTALPAKIETQKDMEDHSFGAYRAKQISLGLRKFLHKLVETRTTLILVDQTRDNVGVAFGDTEITTGGRATEFYSSVRIHLQTESRVKNSMGRDTGVWITFTVKKNKVGQPFRSGYLKIDYDYGLDDILANLRFLAEIQTNSKKEATKKTVHIELNLPDPSDPQKIVKVTKMLKDWVPYIENNNLEEHLRANVLDAWKNFYKPEERKPRSW